MPRQSVPEFTDRWLKAPEVAELLNVSEQIVRHDTVKGNLGLPRYQFGRQVRFRLSEVLRWAEAKRVTPRLPVEHDDDFDPDAALRQRPARRGRRRNAERERQLEPAFP